MNELNWSRVGSKSITGIAGSGEIVPHDSHRAIAQLGSRAKVEADRDLDGGGPGPGSSDNLTLDLVSAAAANAPSLIKKMTRGRYWPLCLLMADIVAKVSNRGATIFPPEDKTGRDRRL